MSNWELLVQILEGTSRCISTKQGLSSSLAPFPGPKRRRRRLGLVSVVHILLIHFQTLMTLILTNYVGNSAAKLQVAAEAVGFNEGKHDWEFKFILQKYSAG